MSAPKINYDMLAPAKQAQHDMLTLAEEAKKLRQLLVEARDALKPYASAGEYVIRPLERGDASYDYDPMRGFSMSVHHKVHHVEAAARVARKIDAALSETV